MWLWVDSGSPVTIFSMTDLKTALGKSKFDLQLVPEESLDYKNNRIHILGKVAVTMALNGWAAPAQVSVIAGNHQSILGRDLMGTLGLELVELESHGNHGRREQPGRRGFDELQT